MAALHRRRSAAPGSEALDLHERVIEAVADVTDSPAGLLLIPAEEGGLALDAALAVAAGDGAGRSAAASARRA